MTFPAPPIIMLDPITFLLGSKISIAMLTSRSRQCTCTACEDETKQAGDPEAQRGQQLLVDQAEMGKCTCCEVS